jgi:phosphatidate cytidylyltransferase
MEQPPDLSRFEDRPPPPPPEEPEEGLSPELVAAGEADAETAGRPRRARLRFLQNETFRRVAFALPAIIFALVIIDVGGALFAAAMLGLALLGLREYFAMTADSKPLPTAAYIAVGGMILAAYLGSSFNVLMALACGFPLMFIEAANRGSHRDVTFSLSITLLGLAWLGLGFSHAVLLEELPTHGHVLLVDVLIGTFVGDTCAYGAGRLFGKRIFGDRRLAAQISPNKTYEGLLGGFLGGTLAFWFAGLYQDWLPGIDALAMGAVIAALAPLGDLFASMIKRDWDIKDTGRLFGPHGGLIDRLDAAMFTIVAGFYLAVAFVY